MMERSAERGRGAGLTEIGWSAEQPFRSAHMLWCVAGADAGKSSESVQCAMLKACDACADMGQL